MQADTRAGEDEDAAAAGGRHPRTQLPLSLADSRSTNSRHLRAELRSWIEAREKTKEGESGRETGERTAVGGESWAGPMDGRNHRAEAGTARGECERERESGAEQRQAGKPADGAQPPHLKLRLMMAAGNARILISYAATPPSPHPTHPLCTPHPSITIGTSLRSSRSPHATHSSTRLHPLSLVPSTLKPGPSFVLTPLVRSAQRAAWLSLAASSSGQCTR